MPRAPKAHRNRRSPKRDPQAKRPDTPKPAGGTLPPWHASGEEECPR